MSRSLVFLSIAALLAPSLALAADDEGKRRVLVLELERGGGVSEDDARTLTTMVATAISRAEGLSVIAGEDVRRMLELEGEKQNVGCDDDASCLGEIAGALAAEWVVFGQASTLGDEVVVNLTLFDAARLEAVKRTSARAPMSGIAAQVERESLALVGESVTPWALYGGVATATAGLLFAGGAVAVALLGAAALEDPTAYTVDEYRQIQLGTLLGAGALGAVGVASFVTSGWLFVVASE